MSDEAPRTDWTDVDCGPMWLDPDGEVLVRDCLAKGRTWITTRTNADGVRHFLASGTKRSDLRMGKHDILWTLDGNRMRRAALDIATAETWNETQPVFFARMRLSQDDERKLRADLGNGKRWFLTVDLKPGSRLLAGTWNRDELPDPSAARLPEEKHTVWHFESGMMRRRS